MHVHLCWVQKCMFDVACIIFYTSYIKYIEILQTHRVKMGNLERPCKRSVNGKLQVKFSVCNVSVN